MVDAILSALVLVVGIPIVVVVCLLVVYRHVVAYAAGQALARWVSRGRWRAPALCIALAFVVLDAAVWAMRLHAPVILVIGGMSLIGLLTGLSGFDYSQDAEGELGDGTRAWWRRSRF